MEVTFAIREEDVVRFNQHLLRGELRRCFIVAWVALCLSMAVLSLALYAWEIAPASPALWGGVFFLVMSVWLPWCYSWGVRWKVNRLLRSGENRALFAERTVRLTPAEIQTQHEHGQSGCRWTAVERIEVKEDALMIFVSSMSAILVPRRAFSDQSAFDEFVETARRYWKAVTGISLNSG